MATSPRNVERLPHDRSHLLCLTDGDRAACIVRSIGVPVESISMLGTRTDVVGRWSGITDESAKLEKLKWMSKVLKILGIKF